MKLLFLGHEASRTGAPAALLHLLRNLGEEHQRRSEVWLRQGGPLQAQYSDICPTRLFPSFPFAFRVLGRLTRGKPGHHRLQSKFTTWSIKHALKKSTPVLFANTAAVASEVQLLSPYVSRVVWHIHEMASEIRQQFSRACDLDSLKRANEVVVVCRDTQDYLIGNGLVDPKRIHFVPELIPVAPFRHKTPDRLPPELSAIGKDESIVGGCGSLSWRKGVDLFIQIAAQYTKRQPHSKVRFVWVGTGNRREQEQVQHDVRLLGLEEQVLFLGEHDHASSLVGMFDMLLLTSREDPCPLVMLEAGSQEVPVIGFQGSGGVADFSSKGGGRCVPYLDLEAYCDAIQGWICDSDSRRAHGRKARAIVERDHDIALHSSRITSLFGL